MIRFALSLLFLICLVSSDQAQQPPIVKLDMKLNTGANMCTWSCIDALLERNGWNNLKATQQQGPASLPDARRFLVARGLKSGSDFTHLEFPMKDFKSRDYELFRWVCQDDHGCLVRFKLDVNNKYHCVCVVGCGTDHIWTNDPNNPVLIAYRYEDFDQIFDGGVIIVRRKKMP